MARRTSAHPPEPLFATAEELGIRWVSYDRPGYGGSTAYPGRDLASAATHVSSIADALGIAQLQQSSPGLAPGASRPGLSPG